MNFFVTKKKWIWPLLFFIVITPFTPWLDISIENYFYQKGDHLVEHFVSSAFFDFLFKYGPLPTNLVALTSALILISAYFFPRLNKWRLPCLVLLLTYTMGNGLITNGLLKEYWGRPRPKQTTLYGGNLEFRPFYKPNFKSSIAAKSFPCGHCTMGFYFFTFALVGLRLKNRALFYSGLITALVFGSLLSFMRMSQGGHFLSDTLASALVMWYTSLAMDWLVYKGEAFP